MVNVYVFRNDATTPDGWTEIAAEKRDRLILGGGTPLSTGGADAHGHSMINISVSSVSTSAIYVFSSTGGGVVYSAESHNHLPSSNSVDNSNNLPPYKNYRLVYRSMVDWNGKIPAGSIMFREELPANFTRIDSGSSYFIRISGTAGGTGGNTGHDHTCYVALDTYTAATQRVPQTSAPTVSGVKYTHGHNSAGGTSSSVNFDYKFWSCGLISADSEQTVKANSYLLFDDTPDGAQWVTVDISGRYLAISSTNSVATGGSNTTLLHTHSLSMDSNTANNCQNIRSSTSSSTYYCSHVHTITATLGEQNIQPPYVNLILARARIDLGSVARAIFVITC